MTANEYRPVQPTPGLRVIESARYAPLPHTVLFDKELSRDAKIAYAVLQTHWWQDDSGGECNVAHETLAEEVGCKPRMLRYYLCDLLERGHITARRLPGMGQAKAYRPTRPATATDGIPDPRASGKSVPVARHEDAPSPQGKRQEIAGQAARDCHTKRQESAAVYRQPVKTPVDGAAPLVPGIPKQPVVQSGPAAAATVAATPPAQAIAVRREVPVATVKPDAPGTPAGLSALPAIRQPEVVQGVVVVEPANRRIAEIVSMVKLAGLPINVSGRDGAAVKASDAAAADIAACYIAIATGTYPEGGDRFMQKRNSIHEVVNNNLNGFLLRDRAVPERRRYGGRGDGFIATGKPGAAVSSDAVRYSYRGQDEW
jgi:hypothetical protein